MAQSIVTRYTYSRAERVAQVYEIGFAIGDESPDRWRAEATRRADQSFAYHLCETGGFSGLHVTAVQQEVRSHAITDFMGEHLIAV